MDIPLVKTGFRKSLSNKVIMIYTDPKQIIITIIVMNKSTMLLNFL